jgi:hypothetical protein
MKTSAFLLMVAVANAERCNWTKKDACPTLIMGDPACCAFPNKVDWSTITSYKNKDTAGKAA